MKYTPFITILGLFCTSFVHAQDENEDTPAKALIADENAESTESNAEGQDNTGAEEADSEDEGVVVRTEIPKPIQLEDQDSGFKLLSPWSPKPMQRAPLGWQYIPADSSHSYKKVVTLQSGKKLKLVITPYILAPESSASVVQILEPGYQPERGYQQKFNIEASLKISAKQLADTSEALDSSIKDLKELLQTLPKAETQAPTQ